MVTMCTDILDPEICKQHVKATHCYHGLKVAIDTTPTEHNTPKTEAENLQLVS